MGRRRRKRCCFCPVRRSRYGRSQLLPSCFRRSGTFLRWFTTAISPEYPGDFTSVEQTADEITAYLKERGVSRLDAAYGCSLGGACLTWMLALVIIEGLTMYLSEADVKCIFDVIAGRFPNATVFVETMNPMVVKRFKEKSIEESHAKFTWGVKNGEALAALLPDFRLAAEHGLTEGMAVFVPIYKVLDKLTVVRNISNKIIVMEKR